MKKKNKNESEALRNVDISLLKNFTSTELLEAFTQPKSASYEKIYDFLEANPLSQTSINYYSNLLRPISDEIEKKFNNNEISLDEIIKNINVESLDYFRFILNKGLSDEPEKLPLFLKKTAHLKNSSTLSFVLKNILSTPYYDSDNLKEKSLNSILQCFKIIDSKGSNTAINLFYEYLVKIDIRNILFANVNPDVKYGSTSYDRNRTKVETLHDILYHIKSFKFDDSKLLDKSLLSITNVQDFYKHIFSSSFINSTLTNNYKFEDLINYTYKKFPESHESLNKYIYNLIDNKKYLNITTMAHAMEYSPITENKILSYILENDLLIGRSEEETFIKIHILTRDCPRLINKIPEKYITDIKYIEKLLLKNSKLFEFLDYSDPNESFHFFKDIVNKTFTDKTGYASEKISLVSNFLSSFPLQKLELDYKTKKDLHEIIKKSLESNYLFKQINSFTSDFKEYLIKEKVITYQQLFEIENKNNSNYLSKKTSLSTFDFDNTERDSELMKSFIDFINNSTSTEILDQFYTYKEDGKTVPFKIIMEVLYHVPKDDFFEYFKSVQERTHPSYSLPINFDTLEDLFNNVGASPKVKNFYRSYLSEANEHKFSPGTFIEQCYMIVEQEKMNKAIAINAKTTNTVKLNKF